MSHSDIFKRETNRKPRGKVKQKEKKEKKDRSTTLFAHMRPQALQRVLGPAGPLRIAGVSFSLTPQ